MKEGKDKVRTEEWKDFGSKVEFFTPISSETSHHPHLYNLYKRHPGNISKTKSKYYFTIKTAKHAFPQRLPHAI